jgi:hypothetical protein
MESLFNDMSSLRRLALEVSGADPNLIDPALNAGNSPSSATESTQSNAAISSTSALPLDDLPDTPTPASAAKITLRWSDPMYHTLLSTMLDQCRLGKRADSGFKKEAWIAVITAVQSEYEGAIAIEEKHVKSKLDWAKLMWKEWCAIDDNSGFGWDEPTQLHTAPDDVWREFLKVRVLRSELVQYLTLQ